MYALSENYEKFVEVRPSNNAVIRNLELILLDKNATTYDLN